MGLLPIKFRILQLINENESISSQDLLKSLKNDYRFDWNLNENSIDQYLISLKSVGMIELTDVVFDTDGKLIQFYKITKYGMDRMKYVALGERKPFKKIG